MPEEEIQQYVSRARQKYGNNVHGISLKIAEDDKDFVEITYDTPVRPFHRLRRITGYLVGDMSRWNNGKRAEEHDRVKHGVE